MQETYRTNKYTYIDVLSKGKFDIFSRTLEFAESLVNRLNNIGFQKLRRKRLGFCKKVLVTIPPYELEQAQLECVEEWEEKEKHAKN